ncbi:PEP-CTERM sorting domain-containing protein [Algisphaera agarilytica]|uniref:Ice-binding protein C-terminal domain-containing protein n=1 Tax=Algisphaera agarilytica TaxID=1385975 RepID=A0A7X0LKR2_9BACT|nr:PEP-CTERM sorting domain-containing protein [Algisphaera agarilytica]MBB6430202.1 hypothetical protein [Algisphaera agarilytica]
MATTVHDETVDGDLSGAFGSPTGLTFNLGANTVIGGVGTNGNTGATNGSDADYFTFTLGTGQSLDAIVVDSYTSDTNAGDLAFSAYVAGNAFAGQGGGNIDASALFNNTSSNIFPTILPLGEGDHAFWIQQTASGNYFYEITFNVVPEPATAGLLMAGTALAAFGRRRQRLG